MTEIQTQYSETCELDSKLGSLLKNSGIRSINNILVLGPSEISRLTYLSIHQANSIYEWAKSKSKSVNSPQDKIFSAAELLQIREKKLKISTGSKSLDEMLSGGIETGAVTEFFGPSGSGKTQLCLALSVNVQLNTNDGGLNGRVLYIDTENKFVPERISQIIFSRGLDVKKMTENIHLIQPLNSYEQEKTVNHIFNLLEKIDSIKLIIVDSIIANYRSEFRGRELLPERQNRLYSAMRLLSNISQIYDIAVVVTNQMQSSPDYLTNKRVSTGGNVMAHASKYRIELSGSIYSRRASVVNSPRHPPFSSTFIIDESGVCDDEEYKGNLT
jgi:DNA repair protein RadA